MPHVSGYPMKNKVSKRIDNQLIKALEDAFGSKKYKGLMNLLFTRTEKIMLAKRLAVIAMIGEGIPTSQIVKILKISPTTVARYIDIAHKGINEPTRHKSEPKKVGRKKRNPLYTCFGLLPPIVGPGRWDFLYKVSDYS